MTTQTLDPVRKAVTVNVSQQRAFDFFTQHFGEWWPLGDYSIGEGSTGATIEPRAGGRWFEHGGTAECDWGQVLAWEPPSRVVLLWQVDHTWRFNGDLVTEVEIRFVAQGDGQTRVELEHRGLDAYGEHGPAMRETFESAQGWGGLLEAYAARAAA